MKSRCRGSKGFTYESFKAVTVDRARRATARDGEAEARVFEIVGAGNNGKLVAAVPLAGIKYLPEISGGEQPHGFVERLLPAA